MHTMQEWHHHAGINMTQAQAAHKKASKQMDESKRAHEITVSDNLNMYTELYKSLDAKVKTSYHLIGKMQHRADSVTKSIADTKMSMEQLEAALRDKEAPLQLNMWRMEQREHRPLREQVRDTVEVALENEKAVLIDTQRKLSDAMKRTRAMIVELEDKLQECQHDIDQKSQALSVDEMCLRTTQRSFRAVSERTPLATSPGSTKLPPPLSSKSCSNQVALQESSKNELTRQKEAERLNQSSQRREETAKTLREENRVLIARCERARDEALARSERAMQERVNENKQMRRRLEGEIQQTLNKIESTKTTISETRYQINALEEPMELTSTCASWRKQRATAEHINDPVSTKIQEHQMTVLKAHQGLVSHHQSEKFNLKDLLERRSRLQEDLKDKTMALHIDLNCLSHESSAMHGRPSKHISKHKLSRAMKVDSNFVPSAHVVMTAR